MSFQDVLPVVRALARGDQLQLIRTLANDLTEDELRTVFGSDLQCEVRPVTTDFEGARKLMALLAAEENKP